MKKNILIIFLLLNCSAYTLFAANIAPTPASNPIPSIQKIKNVDTVLTEEVQAAIAKNTLLKGQSVSASSHDHIVTLEGSVENKNQENAAIRAAKSVKGVTSVKSQITIKFNPK